MKLNVKKALIALVAIVAVVVIGFTISPMNKQEGDKSITITILNDETTETLLENKVLKTDADSLLAISLTILKYLFVSIPSLKSFSLIFAAYIIGLLVSRETLSRSFFSSSLHTTDRAGIPEFNVFLTLSKKSYSC